MTKVAMFFDGDSKLTPILERAVPVDCCTTNSERPSTTGVVAVRYHITVPKIEHGHVQAQPIR